MASLRPFSLLARARGHGVPAPFVYHGAFDAVLIDTHALLFGARGHGVSAPFAYHGAFEAVPIDAHALLFEARGIPAIVEVDARGIPATVDVHAYSLLFVVEIHALVRADGNVHRFPQSEPEPSALSKG